MPPPKVSFRGVVAAVKPRIGLHRSFNETWHSFRGYVLVLAGGPRVAIGPGTHEKHSFRIGDLIEGMGVPVPARTEWAELYKASGLRIVRRGQRRRSERQISTPGRPRSVPGRKPGMVFVDET